MPNRFFLATSLSAVLFSHSAQSADLVDPAAPVAAGYGWSGFYLVIGGGGGAVVHELDILGGIVNFNGIGGEGIYGAATVGYDQQIADRWVAGVFADYRLGNIATNLDIPGFFNADITLDHGFDVIGRLGYLVRPNTLAYVLGGYSHQNFDVSSTIGGISWDADGYVAGVGMEMMLGGNWSLKGEYRYAQYGGENFGLPGLIDLEPSVHTAHFGLNYRFGGGSSGGSTASFAPANYDFSGLKIGGAIGAGAVVHELGILGGLATFDGIGGEGRLLQASVGYDWRVAEKWVFGVGADYRWADISTDLSVIGLDILSVTMDHGYSATARLGYLLDEGTMIYALGGMAWQHFAIDTIIGDTGWDAHGWTAGAGLEAAVNSKITAKLEYRYTDFGGEDFNTGGLLELSPSSHTVTLGLSYKIF